VKHSKPETVRGEVVARFANVDGHTPAVIIHDMLLLTSVHLEALENDAISGLDTASRIENYKYLASLINRVAGTSYYVPRPPASPSP
jgi:hypothetical protein